MSLEVQYKNLTARREIGNNQTSLFFSKNEEKNLERQCNVPYREDINALLSQRMGGHVKEKTCFNVVILNYLITDCPNKE